MVEVLGPASHVGDLDGLLGFCLWLGLPLAVSPFGEQTRGRKISAFQEFENRANEY